jgi:hypothetical protein
LDRTLTDYRTNSGHGGDFAEIARGEDEFADNGDPSNSEAEQMNNTEQEEEVEP